MKMSLLSFLTVLFVGLKLGGVINWGWFWVLAPTTFPLAIGCVIFAIAYAVSVM